MADVDAVALQSLLEAAFTARLGPPSPHGERRLAVTEAAVGDDGIVTATIECVDLYDACAQYDTSTVYAGRVRCRLVPPALLDADLVVVDNGTNYWTAPGRRLDLLESAGPR